MAGFYPQKILDFYGIPYTCAGKKLRIPCPFHDEQNASCYISPDFSWYCFGCGRHGNLIEFIEQLNSENRSLFLGKNDLQKMQECVKILKRAKAGEILGYYTRARPADDAADEAAAEEARAKAWQFFGGLPAVDWAQVAEHGAGDFEPAARYILGRGYTPEILSRAGARFSYDRAYPLIFPICEGRSFRGWVARTLNPQREPKYLYNRGLKKADILAGVRGMGDEAIVTEGVLDRLKLNQAGFIRNVFALLGWHLSDRQERKLKAWGVRFVVCALDNDPAGERGFERLKESFHVYRFRFPPGVKDIGELNGDELRRVCATNLQLYYEWKG